MKQTAYTVITGASRGLGKALAEVCAQKGFHLILISLPGENIARMAENLNLTYKIDAISMEADLTMSKALKKMIGYINSRFNVNMLINNAGMGGSGHFQDASEQYIHNIIMLNIRALALLTHGLLPNLKQQREAYILNIASMASFGPMPYKTVYPASKAFVYSFSRGLSAELHGSNVSVSVAHPGGMATNSDVRERIKQHNKLIRSTILEPEKVANICIGQLLKKDRLIIPGFMNKLSYLLFKTCPIWLQLILYRQSLKKEANLKTQLHYAV